MFTDNISHLPKHKIKAVSNTQISWMDDMHSPHPMQCEEFIWERVHLATVSVSSVETTHQDLIETPEKMMLDNFMKDPAIEWAASHSLDGLHLVKNNNLVTYQIDIAIFAYMEPKHATLWRLKYNRNHYA